MAYISVDVDIDILDYLDEVSTQELIKELLSRKDKFETPEKLLTIKMILGLKEYHTKERLIKEIESLF
jgi:hypothetical protein